MNCSELRDHYELYALALAENPERDEIRAHLDLGCEVCLAQMKRAREMTALLGAISAPAAISPRLRRRILASVGAGQRSFGWTPFLAGSTIMCLAAAFYFGGREWDFSREVLRLNEQSRSQIIEITRLNGAFAILDGPDTTVASFGEKTGQPKGKVFCNLTLGCLLIASNLPQAPAGKAYELWFIPKAKGASPIRAGIFQSESDGTAIDVRRGPVDMDATAALAVTMEADTGVDVPTSTPVIVASLAPALQ
jgi:hypothetical protein